ncbi:MAG: hypothetical protein WCP70_04185 [Methanothrix sp.]
MSSADIDELLKAEALLAERDGSPFWAARQASWSPRWASQASIRASRLAASSWRMAQCGEAGQGISGGKNGDDGLNIFFFDDTIFNNQFGFEGTAGSWELK